MTRSSRDWFRRSTWSAEDEADFFARLRRSRGRKTEYLRLQALTLAETKDQSLLSVALDLIDKALTDSPDNFHLAALYFQRAECLVALGKAREAILAFRASLQARRELPNVVDMAYLEFAWTVARLRLTSHYDEVLEVLREFGEQSDLAFPANAYRYFGALALIASERSDRIAARDWAKDALAAAAEARGPFARHPTFGVLDNATVDEPSHARLWKLAAS